MPGAPMRLHIHVPAAPGWRKVVLLIFGGILIAGAASCGLFRGAAFRPASPTPVPPAALPVTVTDKALAQPTNCEGRFIAHTLSFAAGMRIREIGTYLSNGSG